MKIYKIVLAIIFFTIQNLDSLTIVNMLQSPTKIYQNNGQETFSVNTRRRQLIYTPIIDIIEQNVKYKLSHEEINSPLTIVVIDRENYILTTKISIDKGGKEYAENLNKSKIPALNNRLEKIIHQERILEEELKIVKDAKEKISKQHKDESEKIIQDSIQKKLSSIS